MTRKMEPERLKDHKDRPTKIDYVDQSMEVIGDIVKVPSYTKFCVSCPAVWQ